MQQCWFEITDVRDSQRTRHRRLRSQLQKLTEDFTQSQSATECKDDFVKSQISSLSKQLTAIEESITLIEKARKHSDTKTTEIEAYVSQVTSTLLTTADGGHSVNLDL